MSIQERDDARTQLDQRGRDRLCGSRLRAVLDPFDESWIAIDDPDNGNDEEWIKSDVWLTAGEMR